MATKIRKKGKADWGLLLDRLAGGIVIRDAVKGPSLPGRKALARRRASDPAFARAFRLAKVRGSLARDDVGRRARLSAAAKRLAKKLRGRSAVSKGRHPRPDPSADRDWDDLLRRVAAGERVYKIAGKDSLPTSNMIQSRRVRDAAFAARLRKAMGSRRGALIEDDVWESFFGLVDKLGTMKAACSRPGMPTYDHVRKRFQRDTEFARRVRDAIKANKRRRLDNTLRWLSSGKSVESLRGRGPTFSRSYVQRHLQADSEIGGFLQRAKRGEVTDLLSKVRAALCRSPKVVAQIATLAENEMLLDILDGAYMIEDAPTHIKDVVARAWQGEASRYAVSLDGLAEAGFDASAGTMPWARSARKKSEPTHKRGSNVHPG